MMQKFMTGLALAIAMPFSLALEASRGYRLFSLTVTWGKHSPDGFMRDMILINGQFPGPVLEANEGDEVWVEVFNLTPFNTTMHYHVLANPTLIGIEMSQTPWSDGVPGVSQRQILPG
ncbi:uncharacterized protein MCYG_05061, partial [Microsporum canis CBS 113480]